VASKLGVNHYLEVVGIVNNEMQAPDDGTYAIGWYPDFGLPGNGGNAVITAHETWNHMQGPFYGIHNAVLGDEINVKMADGRTLVYKVISNRRYQVDGMPMGDIIWPSIRPRNEEWRLRRQRLRRVPRPRRRGRAPRAVARRSAGLPPSVRPLRRPRSLAA
jgi:hypothetical protein